MGMLRTVGDDALLLREVVVVTPPAELPAARCISPLFPLWSLPFPPKIKRQEQHLRGSQLEHILT